MKKYLLGTLSVSALPLVALAQGQFGAASDLTGVVNNVTYGLNLAVVVGVSLAAVYFIYSLLKYISSGGGEKGEAKAHMFWGVVIIAVMVSVWGLVNILVRSFVTNPTSAPTVPELPVSR